MAQYNLTNHWIEFRYTVNSLQHVQKFQVNSDTTTPTGTVVGVNLITKDGSNLPMADFLADYTTAISQLFSTPEATFDSATLWYQPDGALEPQFIASSSGSVAWAEPVNTFPPQQGAQATFTFRAADGKILKFAFLETYHAPHSRTPLSAVVDGDAVFRDYILSADCPIQSRSGAYSLAGMNRTVVYNDKIVRKRYSVD